MWWVYKWHQIADSSSNDKKTTEASLNNSALHVPDKLHNISDFPLSLLQSGLLTCRDTVGQKLWQYCFRSSALRYLLASKVFVYGNDIDPFRLLKNTSSVEAISSSFAVPAVSASGDTHGLWRAGCVKRRMAEVAEVICTDPLQRSPAPNY